jgi:hypothetical protein
MRTLSLIFLLSTSALADGLPLLTGTSDVLRLFCISGNAVNYVTGWADITTTSFTPGSSQGTAGSSATTIVAAPAASTQRQVKSVFVYNASAGINACTVQKYNGTAYSITPSLSLPVGYGFALLSTGQLIQYDSSGLPLSGSSGSTGKVSEAYMADASITAQWANVAATAFSADAAGTAGFAGAFDHDPTACSAGQYVTDQTAAGVLACAQVDATQLSNPSSIKVGAAYMADASITAAALAANPADCSANQYATTIAANGDLTCAQVTTAQLSGTITNAQLASSYSGVGACGANTWASTLGANAAPTCTQPAFTNLSGSASLAQNGTGAGSPAGADSVLQSTAAGTTAWSAALPNCTDTGGNHLNYTSATHAFSCGTTSSGGGGGAPTTATYITQTPDGTLSAEQAMSLLSTGIVKNTTTTGVLSIAAAGTDYGPPTSGNATGLVLSTTTTGAHTTYAGTTCTNQFARSLNTSGAATCNSVASADLAITATSCTNQFVSAVSTTGVGTCTTDTLASAQHANQGTATTLLHGNAAGNPTWAGVSLTADTTANQGTATTVLHGNAAGQPSFGAVALGTDVSGNLAITAGGTGVASRVANDVVVGTGANTTATKVIPSCSNATTSKLLFDNTTQTFSCGTDQTSAGGGYATVQDEGGALTARTVINFTGAGVTCADNAGSTRTDCTIPGGSGAPAAGEGQLQWNSGGSFASATYARVDGGYLHIVDAPEPGVIPDDGGVLLFSETRANMSLLGFKGTAGYDKYAQTAIWADSLFYTKFSGASAAKSDFGWATTVVGTAAAATYASTNLSTSIARMPYSTGATASTPVELRSGQLQFWRGNAAGLGGFFCSGRWTTPTHNANSDKMFVGLQNSVAAVAGTVVPSATLNAVYCGYDAAATAHQLCGNDGTGTATCVTCSATDFPITSTTNVYECDIFSKPNGTAIDVELRRLDSSVTSCKASFTAAGDMPANTSFLGFRIWGSNGATAANFALSFISMYCSTDH